MRKSCLIPMLLTVAFGISGCVDSGRSQDGSSWEEGIAVDPAGVYRLHKKDLESLGLETAWAANRLLTNPDTRIIKAYALGDLLLLETSEKRLFGINRKTGTPMWCEDLPYYSDFRGCQDDDNIYLACRNTLVAIDRRGMIVWRQLMKYAPGGTPVANADHVYIPCFDGRMRSYLKVSGKDSGYFDRQYTTGGRMQSKSALSQTLVFCASHDGFVYALDIETLERSWKFKTYDRIVGDVVLRGTRLYVASTDGSLYCLNTGPMDTRQQQLDWHRPYATGDAIRQTPYLTSDKVMVVNQKGECHAVDVNHGKRRWVVPNITKVLTQGRLNTYLLRGDATIVAVDNQTGTQRWELDTSRGKFAFILTNTEDDLIYMVGSDGGIQTIRERKAPVKTKPVAIEDVEDVEDADVE